MNDVTEFIEKPDGKQSKGSHIMSLSTRAIGFLMVVGTICWMSINGMDVKEPLYTLGGMVIGYYFGQVEKPKVQKP